MANIPSDIGNNVEELAATIYRSIETNDQTTLRRCLEWCKMASVPLPIKDEELRSPPPLHLAAYEPHYKKCLEMILEYNSSVLFGIDDTWAGMTAFHIACLNGCEESIPLLVLEGCDPYAVTLASRKSALHIAALRECPNVLDYLLTNYPDNIDQSDKDGRTPLHIALSQNNIETAKRLLEKGVNISAADNNGNLPLHLVCMAQNYNFDMVRVFVERDLKSINDQNAEGKTPLMLAAKNPSSIQGVRYLCENGAETGICDRLGRMALHFAAGCGDVQVLEYVLQHTDTSHIEQCFMNIPNILRERNVIYSLAACAIHSRNVDCLEILLSSNKLSKCILQTPHVEQVRNYPLLVHSPLAAIFNRSYLEGKKLKRSLTLLLKYRVTAPDEFFNVLEIKWPLNEMRFQHPFSRIFNYDWQFSKQQRYFHLLKENDVTIDYCLQFYHNNSQPFATFTDYKRYYEPAMVVLYKNKIEALKLIMSNSAILEPDELLIQFHSEPYDRYLMNHDLYSYMYITSNTENRENIYKYLISLKPIYYRQFQLCNDAGQDEPSWYPYSTTGEEFCECTLQQLCRTTIRRHIRKHTLEDNLRNFQRDISNLRLPPVLKDYLLFKT